MSKNAADFLFSPISEQDGQLDLDHDSDGFTLPFDDDQWMLHSNGSNGTQDGTQDGDHAKEITGIGFDLSNPASIRHALLLALKSGQWTVYKEVIQHIEQSNIQSKTAIAKHYDCLILDTLLNLAEKSEREDDAFFEETRNIAINCSSLRAYLAALDKEIKEKKAKVTELREKNQNSHKEKSNLEQELKALLQAKKELDRKKRECRSGKDCMDLSREFDDIPVFHSKSIDPEAVVKFLRAIADKKLGEMSKLLAEYPDLLDAYDENGKTCLIFAVAKNTIHSAALLLIEEANRKRTKPQNLIFKCDKDGYRAIDVAILLDNLNMVKLLLQEDDDSYQVLGQSIAHIVDRAARIGQVKILKYLLEHPKERRYMSLVKKEQGGLLRLALETGNKEVLDYLLERENEVRTMLLLPDSEATTTLVTALNIEGSKQKSELCIKIGKLCLAQNPLQILHKSKINTIFQPDLMLEFQAELEIDKMALAAKTELQEHYALKIFIYDRLCQFLENTQSKAFKELRLLFEVQNTLIQQALGQLRFLEASVAELQKTWREEHEISAQIASIKNEIKMLQSVTLLKTDIQGDIQSRDAHSAHSSAIQKLQSEAAIPRMAADRSEADSIEMAIYTELQKGQDLNIEVFRKLLKEDRDVLFATIGKFKEDERPLTIAALEHGSVELASLLFSEVFQRISASPIAPLVQKTLSLENIQLSLQQELQDIAQLLFNKLNENLMLEEQLTRLQDLQQKNKTAKEDSSKNAPLLSVELIDTFFQAILRGDIVAVQTIMTDYPVIIYELQDGITSLMSAASHAQIDIIQLLLQCDKSQKLLFQVTADGWNAAHFAVYDNTLETLMTILKFDTESRLLLGRIHESGCNPLYLAIEKDKLDIARFLIEHPEFGPFLRFSRNASGENLVDFAFKHQFFDFALELLTKFPSEFISCNDRGRTMLMDPGCFKQHLRNQRNQKNERVKASSKNKAMKFNLNDDIPVQVETTAFSRLLTHLLHDFTMVLRRDLHGNNVFDANLVYCNKKISKTKLDPEGIASTGIIQHYSFVYQKLLEILEKPNPSYFISKIRTLNSTITLLQDMIADFREMVQEREALTVNIQVQSKAIQSELDSKAMPPPAARPRKRGALLFSDAVNGSSTFPVALLEDISMPSMPLGLSIVADLPCTGLPEDDEHIEPIKKKHKCMSKNMNKKKDIIKFI